MALASKGSRRIVVDGVEFRWKVRSRPTYCQAMGWSPLTFAVQQADAPGARLMVYLPCAHPSNAAGLPAGVVLPRTVVAAITTAKSQGWTPSERGPEFNLKLDDSTLLNIVA
ncbi:hypothetical protein [Spirillospora sp. NPDC029432]|uniref:hypothetical protein n=1 Tax=Spirillospora sp. NPDC029432 TaxID=3154599 RepID=UPI0034547CD2